MSDKLNYAEEYYVEEYGANGIYFRFTPDPIEGVTFDEIAQVLKDTYISRFIVRRNEDKNRYDGILLNQDNFQLCIDTDEMYGRITGEVTVMREDPEIIDYMATRNVSGSVLVLDIDKESQSVIFCTCALYWNNERA